MKSYLIISLFSFISYFSTAQSYSISVVSEKCNEVVLEKPTYNFHIPILSFYWQTSSTGTSTTSINTNSTYTLTGSGNKTIYLRKKNNYSNEWSTIDQYTTYLYPALVAGAITGVNDPICSGESITLSGTKPQGGNGTYSYKWQSKPPGSSHLITYQDIPNSNVQSLKIDVFSSAFFRRLDYSSTCDFEITNEVYISDFYTSHSVNPGSIGNRSDYTIGTLNNATWGDEPEGLLSYHWQESSDNSKWNDVIGQIDSWITPTYDRWYRRKVITPCGDEAVTSSVQAIRPITVVSEDCDEAVLEAPPATNHLSTYGYYWQTSPTGTITTGSNANREYTLTGDGNTTIYLRKKSNIDGTWSTIDQYTTYLYPVFIAGVITGINGPICSGESITLSGTKPQGGNGTYSYKWQSKPAGSSHLITYQDIPNSNVESLTIDVFSSAFFRRLDYSSDCDFEVTNEVYISDFYTSHSVNPGSIGNRSDYTIGTLNNATWGDEPEGLLSYHWQESSENSKWNDVIGQIDSWITPTYDKWYRRKVITPCGDEAVTSSVQAIRPITVVSEDCDEAVLEAPPITSV